MQDFYNQFKVLFNLNRTPFINFIYEYTNIGNYCDRYGDLEDISEYYKSIGKLLEDRKDKKDKFRLNNENSDNLNIFDWNNKTIVKDIESVLHDFAKKKVEVFHINYFILFLIEDLENAVTLFQYNENHTGIPGGFGLESNNFKNYLTNSLRIINVNKDLLNNLQKEKEEISKSPKIKTKQSTPINIKKFIWTDTEKNLLILVELLIESGLIDQSCFDKRYAIIRDTLLNKNEKPFKSGQLSVANNSMDFRKDKINNPKFEKLLNSLTKVVSN